MRNVLNLYQLRRINKDMKINKNHFFTQFAKDVLKSKVVVDENNVCLSVKPLKWTKSKK